MYVSIAPADGPVLPPLVSGAWYGPFGTPGVLAFSGNRLAFVDIDVPYVGTRSINQLSIDVSGAGTGSEVVRLGVYSSRLGLPDVSLLDAGTVSATTTGSRTINVDFTFPSGGMYFLAYAAQVVTSSVQVRTVTGLTGRIGTAVATAQQGRIYYQDGVSGSFPATATPLTTASTAPAVKMRVA